MEIKVNPVKYPDSADVLCQAEVEICEGSVKIRAKGKRQKYFSIRDAQYAALKAVNNELVGLYWDIGRMIFEKQKELGWGKAVVENIAKDLQVELPESKGFSS